MAAAERLEMAAVRTSILYEQSHRNHQITFALP
jgi:hypothetical protein